MRDEIKRERRGGRETEKEMKGGKKDGGSENWASAGAPPPDKLLLQPNIYYESLYLLTSPFKSLSARLRQVFSPPAAQIIIFTNEWILHFPPLYYVNTAGGPGEICFFGCMLNSAGAARVSRLFQMSAAEKSCREREKHL